MEHLIWIAFNRTKYHKTGLTAVSNLKKILRVVCNCHSLLSSSKQLSQLQPSSPFEVTNSKIIGVRQAESIDEVYCV